MRIPVQMRYQLYILLFSRLRTFCEYVAYQHARGVPTMYHIHLSMCIIYMWSYIIQLLQEFPLHPINWTLYKFKVYFAHVIIIIKSEVSTFPIVIIFFRGRVPEMFLTPYSVTCAIYIPDKPDFVFVIIVQFMMSMMSANSRIHFVLQIAFICLYFTPSHYHHCPKFFEDLELIKCLPDIFCRVCE